MDGSLLALLIGVQLEHSKATPYLRPLRLGWLRGPLPVLGRIAGRSLLAATEVETESAPPRAATRLASACIAGSFSRNEARSGGAIKIEE